MALSVISGEQARLARALVAARAAVPVGVVDPAMRDAVLALREVRS